VLHKFSRGGSDRVAAYLARGFAEAGMDVDLVVFTRGGEVEDILSEMVGSDIPIRYLGGRGTVRPLDLILGLPRLTRFLRSQAPDAVISTANNTAWVTAIALKLAGLRNSRLILKTTNPIASSRHSGLIRRLRRWGYRLAFGWTDAVWTLSAEESAEMRAAFPEFPKLFRDVANPYVTPKMLAGPAATAPGQAEKVGKVGKTVITVARLTAQKRLDRLIAAFAQVRDRDVRLQILGEGEDRPALTAQIAALGLQDRVALPGYVTDVAQALHQADLFVLPSDYEGLPAAVLEAMAANCPVLCTDCFPAARTIVGQSEGCAIIAQTDPAYLAGLIEDHLNAPKPKALRQVAERYSVANGVADHLAALRQVLGARTSSSA
jgi:glycosyltransferase involved in cell wall biosynthesis